MPRAKSPKKALSKSRPAAVTGKLRAEVEESVATTRDWQWEEALLAAMLRDMSRKIDPGEGTEREHASDERRRRVRKLIGEMPPDDQALMRAVFLEERDKDAVCRAHGVGRDYLQELIYRAKERFRELSAQVHAPQPDVDLIIARAVAVIGGRDEAMRWLGAPVRALDYATPISLLGTSEGTARVEDVFGQIEHGVW